MECGVQSKAEYQSRGSGERECEIAVFRDSKLKDREVFGILSSDIDEIFGILSSDIAEVFGIQALTSIHLMQT